MRTCDQCGHGCSEGEDFCPECGSFVDWTAADGNEYSPPCGIHEISPVLVDIAVSVSAAGLFEGGKALAKSVRSKREKRNVRIYTEAELMEHSQRALASRLSVPRADLRLRSIQTTPDGECVADYVLETSQDRYRVTTTMEQGIALITRLQHEIAP